MVGEESSSDENWRLGLSDGEEEGFFLGDCRLPFVAFCFEGDEEDSFEDISEDSCLGFFDTILTEEPGGRPLFLRDNEYITIGN